MERWRNIKGFPGYQVSDKGRVRSYRHSKEPVIMSTSDDGNGYQKLALHCDIDGKRYCRKVHRLVAEAFIPHKKEDDTVDHIESGKLGKLNNSVENLRWLSRAENIKKAYRDGMCDERIERSKKPIIATDLWTGEERFFPSIGDAAEELKIDRSSISHVLIGDQEKTKRYTFEYCGREGMLLYGLEYYGY